MSNNYNPGRHDNSIIILVYNPTIYITMSKYVLGVDIGTTSIKAVLIEHGSKAVVVQHSLATNSDIDDCEEIQAKEQDTCQIIRTLNECIAFLPRDKLRDVIGIGVSGQMHGVLFWKGKNACDWSCGDSFTAKDCSQLVTWQDGRCGTDFLSALPKPRSHISVATGFGCATIFWYAKHRAEFLADFTVAGTIQDYVVSMLCGLDTYVMSPQNAASWGYYNTATDQWNVDILKGAGFPVHLLPHCVASGRLAGETCREWHGVPAGTPVGAALGDFQCSVYSCMAAPTDAVLNISTSAQLTYAMPAGFSPPDVPQPMSPVSHVPYFDGSYLAVAASLNGGNAMATFVGMLGAWMNELGVELSDSSSLYEKLISSALSQEDTDMKVRPTLLGERHDPQALAAVSHISAGSSLSLGHVTRALCRGILDNLASMMPAAALEEAGVTRVVGTGSALCRNQALRQEAERAFGSPQRVVEYREHVDSAAGAAMVFCDRV